MWECLDLINEAKILKIGVLCLEKLYNDSRMQLITNESMRLDGLRKKGFKRLV